MSTWLRENDVSQNSFPSMIPKQNWPKEKNIDEIREKQHHILYRFWKQRERDRCRYSQWAGASLNLVGEKCKVLSISRSSSLPPSALCLTLLLGDQYPAMASALQKVKWKCFDYSSLPSSQRRELNIEE